MKIPIEKLAYRWESRVANPDAVTLYKGYEKDLKTESGRAKVRGSVEKLEGLYHDIKVKGIRNPLTVVESAGRYYVFKGNNRLAIARSLGLTELECFVLDTSQLRLGERMPKPQGYVPMEWDEVTKKWKEQ